jgi:hypothetical protein
MKPQFLSALIVFGALLLVAGCGHVDLTAEGSRSRLLRGTLQLGQTLPAGAEVLVRVIAPPGGGPAVPVVTGSPMARPTPAGNDQILGEFLQTLTVPATDGMPFQIEFAAEDALLRRGVNLEARVYFNGRVRFRTVNAHVVTANSVHFPQTLPLQAVDR